MILVDSSVWIDHLNGRDTTLVSLLHRLLLEQDTPILVGDIIMYEILCGLRTQQSVVDVNELLESLMLVQILDFDVAGRAAAYYRVLRARGITVNTADMLIGTYCIASGVELLSSDRDFLPMRDHLGLRLIAADDG